MSRVCCKVGFSLKEFHTAQSNSDGLLMSSELMDCQTAAAALLFFLPLSFLFQWLFLHDNFCQWGIKLELQP